MILELGNFSSQTINLNVDNTKDKTDDELIKELQGLLKGVPELEPKLVSLQEEDEGEDVTKH